MNSRTQVFKNAAMRTSARDCCFFLSSTPRLQGFQRLSRVRRPKILRRSYRNDPSRINIVVSKVIMALDVIEIHGTGDSINLVKITKVTVQAGVISDPADVAFKMTIVNRVEPNQRDEKPPVGFER